MSYFPKAVEGTYIWRGRWQGVLFVMYNDIHDYQQVIIKFYRNNWRAVPYIYIYLILTFLGEPFTQEELEEMLSAAVDPEKGCILYKEYVSRMTIEEV